jgi:hypothetical protein
MSNLKNKISILHLFAKKAFSLVIFLLSCFYSMGEGTKQLRPSYNANAHIVVMRTAAPENNFASYFSCDASPDNNSLRFRIANTNERIYLGFGRYKVENDPSPNNSGNIATHNENFSSPANRVLRYRIRLPNAAMTSTNAADFLNPGGYLGDVVPASGQGYMGDQSQAAYDRAVAGPAQLVGTTGYNALVFTPTITGDYYIEFVLVNTSAATSCVVAGLNFENIKTSLQIFDLTVATGVGPFDVQAFNMVTGAVNMVNASGGSGTAINGRLWSRAWRLSTGRNYRNDAGGIVGTNGTNAMSMPDPTVTNNLFIAKMYPYAEDDNAATNDAVVTELDFNGMDPFGFTVTCTRDGLNTDPDFILSKRSQYGLATGLPTIPPPYRIFLQDPDNTQFPNGRVGCLQGISVKQCAIGGTPPAPRAYCINIEAQATGAVEVLIDLWNNTTNMPGADGVYTPLADNPMSTDVLISQAILVDGITCVPWDGEDGLGNEVADGANISILVAFRAGLTNLPINDVENHPNGFRVSLVRPITNACGNMISLPKLYWDDTSVQSNFNMTAPENAGYTFNTPPVEGTGPAGTFGIKNLGGCNPALLMAGEGCHRWVRRGKNPGTTSGPPGSISIPSNYAFGLETMNTWWYVADEQLNTTHINDKSLFDITSTLSAGTCVVNDFGEITIDAEYNTAKFTFTNNSEVIVTVTPAHGTYQLVELSKNVNDMTAPLPPMGKGRIRLVYRLDVNSDGVNTGAIVPSVGFTVVITTNLCGNPEPDDAQFNCSVVILPIELSSFKGKLVDGQLTKLDWTTAREVSNKGFGIQRSIDGRNFFEIDFIQSKGNTSHGHQYSYLDKLPYRGVYYYRLRQVDEDGKETFSKMITVSAEDLELDFINTTYLVDSNTLQVMLRQKSPEDLQITVYNMLGVEVQCLKIPAQQNNQVVQIFSLPMNVATVGTYIVEVKDSKNVSKKKIMIY